MKFKVGDKVIGTCPWNKNLIGEILRVSFHSYDIRFKGFANDNPFGGYVSIEDYHSLIESEVRQVTPLDEALS